MNSPCLVLLKVSAALRHLYEQSKYSCTSKLMSQENEPWLVFHPLTSNITLVFIVNIKSTALNSYEI